MVIKELENSPWILLPGTLCTGAVFGGFMDALGVPATQRNVVQLDRPSVEAYRANFENLPERTIVCGFSLGAIVAAHFADRMEAQILILFGLNPIADDPAKAQSRLDLEGDVNANGGAVALHKRALEVYGQSPANTRKQIYAMADASAEYIDAQTQLALTRPGALPALANAHMPVLCLTGSQDTSAPMTQGMAAAQTAPNGQFCSLDGLGHFALIEAPDVCAAAVMQFMETQYDAG